MKKIAYLFLALLALALPARAEFWPADHEVRCGENRAGCRVLQMVMMGSFSVIDVDDALSMRIMAAVLPQLRAVTQEDIDHFLEEYSVEAQTLNAHYFTALANCLHADIHVERQLDEQEALVRRVLHLFLDPSTAPVTAKEEMEIISEGMTEEMLEMMAQSVALPKDFIRALIDGVVTVGKE